MSKLTQADLRNVVQHLPRDVRNQLSRNPGKLFVGGGFIRAIVAGEKPSDIDMFGESAARLGITAEKLVGYRKDDGAKSKLHVTKNAITLLTENRMPIQFITRWLFQDCNSLIDSFDFTVCAAAVYYQNGQWQSQVNDSFYSDLASRRLVYTFPQREEEAGGSMLRVLKYLKRGYHIQIDSLSGVMSRVMSAANKSIYETTGKFDEANFHTHTKTLLREVDPLLVIDGLDVVDDHEKDEDMNDEIPKFDHDDIPF